MIGSQGRNQRRSDGGVSVKGSLAAGYCGDGRPECCWVGDNSGSYPCVLIIGEPFEGLRVEGLSPRTLGVGAIAALYC